MAIKNYTSKVDAFVSIGEIQAALTKGGARKIMQDYDDDGQPIEITFGLPINGEIFAFKLPANIEGVRRIFQKEKIKGDKQQIVNTAWRNIRDWVLAQMALIAAGNAQMEEVFLPYLTNGDGRTVYDLFREGRLSLPEGGND